MPLLLAPVPFADTRAADLGFHLGPVGTPWPALATEQGPAWRDLTCELRVLGASHQVVLERDELRWAETLACGAGDGYATLPSTHTTTVAGLAYRCDLGLTTADDDTHFRRLARTVTGRGGVRLEVAFDGDPDARTVIHADRTPTGLRWQTWHLYPQHREIVHTLTTLTDPTELEAPCPL